MAETMQEFFNQLQFDPKNTAGMNAVYQFVATGEGGGAWFVKIVNGEAEKGEGTVEKPSIVLSADNCTWLDILNKKTNGQTAFLTGKLKIQGDVTLALKLQTLFSLV